QNSHKSAQYRILNLKRNSMFSRRIFENKFSWDFVQKLLTCCVLAKHTAAVVITTKVKIYRLIKQILISPGLAQLFY
ncbi:hypothetical protein ACJX0J_014405, partial [Zea mays]